MVTQFDVPLIKALNDYCLKNKANFHVPAHRQGQALPEEIRHNNLIKWDLTELPGLDDLHNPKNVIAQAQFLAAEAYGSKRCYFVVNGTSGGLMALMMATAGENDAVIIPRNAHRSALSGLIFSGARPIYIYPQLLQEFGIAVGNSPKDLKKVIESNPDVKSVLVVHPNYYGVSEKINILANIAHSYNKPLLVDEAHGAHFRFHPGLPMDALAGGADAVVQSTHKTAGAMTQASMVHINSNRINQYALEESLSMLQTTSPSYVLMASLDAARHQMATEGRDMIEKSLKVARVLRKEISQMSNLEVLSPHHLGDCDILMLDETRLVINVNKTGLSGYEAAELMSNNYNVQVEMADSSNIVALLGLNADKTDQLKFYQALDKLSKHTINSKKTAEVLPLPPRVVQAITPRKAWLSKKKSVLLEGSLGSISADSIAVYPPGIPAVYPGEVISAEMIDYLLEARARKMHVHCSGDASMKFLRVVV
ncbi:MAG: aminotransferase class I/II-fold pyridoxal phosphate-dependent enzyme [Firmicutes bacterium]|nr:aminotransferase class I/II-fold pyridoxal phosphate-dependent enzyme [Bacillota bacterium]